MGVGEGDAEEVGAGISTVKVKVLLSWTVSVVVPVGSGGVEEVGDGEMLDEGARKPVTDRVVWLANVGGDELDEELLVVGD